MAPPVARWLRLNRFPGDASDSPATFELWIQPTDALGNEVLFESGSSTTGISIQLNGGNVEFHIKNGASTDTLSSDISAEIASGEFIQLVGSIDTATGQSVLYVNGVQVDTATDAGLTDWSDSDNAAIGQVNGSVNVGSPSNFEGEISIFRYYDAALTSTAVESNYDLVAEPWNLLTITELNGAAYTAGTATALPSGATVTLFADGSYTYDPTTQTSYQALNNGENAVDSFTYTVTDGSGSATATVDLTINGVNDQLSATNTTQTQTYTEDTGNVAIDDIVVSDVDNAETYSVTLTLDDITTGALTANDGANYDAVTGEWTISGDAATVNTALANLEFVPVADNATNTFISVAIQDGNEDGTTTVTGQIDLNVTAVNDAPIATAPTGPIVGTEDTPLTISGISFSDIDAAAGDVTVTLTVADGILTIDETISGGLVAGDIEDNGTDTVVLTGTIDEINATLAALDALQYEGDEDFDGTDTLNIEIIDNGNTGVDPQTVGQPATGNVIHELDTAFVGITLTGENDAPDLDVNSSDPTSADYETFFTEGDSAIPIADLDTEIIDADDANINSALITLTNPQIGDVLTALDSDPGWPAGISAVVSPTSDQISLTGSATKAEYETALTLLRFENTNNSPSTVDRIIQFTVNDGLLDSNIATTSVTVIPLPGLIISDASTDEGDFLVFTLTLDAPATDTITLDMFARGITATEFEDFDEIFFEYLPEGQSLWIPGGGLDQTEIQIAEGDSSVQVRLATFDDVYAEGGETIELSVGQVVAGTIVDTSDVGIGTINDEAIPDTTTVSLTGPATVVEGDTTTAYTVSVDSPTASDLTVNFIYSGTATDGTDFNGVSSVVIAAGNSSTDFTIASVQDSLYEGVESIVIEIDSFIGGGFEELVEDAGNNQVTTTIDDTADIPTVSLTNVTVTEEVDPHVEFTLSLSNPSFEDVTATLAFTDVTATGGGTDYGAADATNLQVFVGGAWVNATSATILAGDTTILVRTPLLDDVFDDAGETFDLTATVTSGTTTNASTTGTGTINDEATPDVATVTLVGPSDVLEGETTTPYTLDVDFTAAADINVTLKYSGTATDGTDFTGVTIVTILQGTDQATFTLDTVDDGIFEGVETIIVEIDSLTGGGFESIEKHATINTVTTTMTDSSTPTLTVSDATATEEIDGFAVFNISIDNVSFEDISFDLALTGVTATGGGIDFGDAGSANLQVFDGTQWVDTTSAIILAGDGTTQIRTPILDDALADAGETFTLTATVTSGTTTNATAFGTGTIQDEATPDTAVVSISGPATVTEGATTTDYTVTVTDAPAIDLVVNLTYSGTATDGSDFTGVADVTIVAGTTSSTFTIGTIDDPLNEGIETFVVDIDSFEGGGYEAVAAHATQNQVTTTISDNDLAQWAITGDTAVTEGNDASYAIQALGALGANESMTVTLGLTDVDTSPGDIQAPGNNQNDFLRAVDDAVASYAGPGVLSFSRTTGVLTFTATNDGDTMSNLLVDLTANSDSTVEDPEDYTLSLSSPSSSTGLSVGLHASKRRDHHDHVQRLGERVDRSDDRWSRRRRASIVHGDAIVPISYRHDHQLRLQRRNGDQRARF